MKRLLGNISNSPSMNVRRVRNSHQLTVCSDQKKYQLKNQSSKRLYRLRPFNIQKPQEISVPSRSQFLDFFYYLCIKKSKTNGTYELEIFNLTKSQFLYRTVTTDWTNIKIASFYYERFNFSFWR